MIAALWTGNPQVFLVLLFVLIAYLASRQESQRRERVLSLRDLASLSPRDLEVHVGDVIKELPGWKTEVTRSSSDQGADVIAISPGGVRVAIQVKKYADRVGNEAVQQVVASMAYYRCTHSVVFTSGPGYTRQAQELAAPNGTALWTSAQLFELQDLASARQVPPPELLPA